MFLILNDWGYDSSRYPCAYATSLDECRQFAERWIQENEAPGASDDADERQGLIFQDLPHCVTQTASDECRLPEGSRLVQRKRDQWVVCI